MHFKWSGTSSRTWRVQIKASHWRSKNVFSKVFKGPSLSKYWRLISRPVSTPYSRPHNDVLENYLHDQVFPQAEVKHNENNSSLEFKVASLPQERSLMETGNEVRWQPHKRTKLVRLKLRRAVMTWGIMRDFNERRLDGNSWMRLLRWQWVWQIPSFTTQVRSTSWSPSIWYLI